MKNIVLNILSILFALMFFNAGLNKFLNYMPMPENMSQKMLDIIEAYNLITWLMPLVGFVEIIGALLIAFPKTRALGAIVIFPIVVGIILSNIFTEISGLVIALPFAVINLWILWENRAKYLPMVS